VLRPTAAAESEPWRALPVEVAAVIEPEIPALTGEILAAIAREVPEYARPLEGSFGRGIRRGVGEALDQFVALVRDPDSSREHGREVYVALGRGEMREGRSLDSLQAAYRVGARVAWRHLGASGLAAGLEPKVLNLLAEAIFAYIDELSADSVEGYADARSVLEGERQRRRRELLGLLLREPASEQADIDAASRSAGWTPPRSAAALACAEQDLSRLARRLPEDALVSGLDRTGCAVVADPEGPGRAAQLESAAAGMVVVLGTPGAPAALPFSWRTARTALDALREGAIEAGEGLVRSDDHLARLLLRQERALLDRISARRLSSFEDLTPRARERMEETALAYVQQQGNAAAMARALHVHPQTARYRLGRLRELLGDSLDDPDARFELEAVLRAGSPTSSSTAT
jgi:hypothetical protein